MKTFCFTKQTRCEQQNEEVMQHKHSANIKIKEFCNINKHDNNGQTSRESTVRSLTTMTTLVTAMVGFYRLVIWSQSADCRISAGHRSAGKPTFTLSSDVVYGACRPITMCTCQASTTAQVVLSLWNGAMDKRWLSVGPASPTSAQRSTSVYLRDIYG